MDSKLIAVTANVLFVTGNTFNWRVNKIEYSNCKGNNFKLTISISPSLCFSYIAKETNCQIIGTRSSFPIVYLQDRSNVFG